MAHILLLTSFLFIQLKFHSGLRFGVAAASANGRPSARKWIASRYSRSGNSTRGLHFCVLSNPPNPTYSHACLILDQIIRRSEDPENTSTDILDSHIIFDFLFVSSHSSDFRGCSRSQQHQQMDGRQPRMGCLEVLNTFWQIHPRLAFLDAFKFT